MSAFSIPTQGGLPPSLRLSADNPIVYNTLYRLSRSSLLALVLDWLDDKNIAVSQPYLCPTKDLALSSNSSDLYPAVGSVEQLRALYTGLQDRKGSKREVLNRLLEGDWRHGLTLYQLSMAGLQYLYDHPASEKWMAYRILPSKAAATLDVKGVQDGNRDSTHIPRIHPSTFLERLQSYVLPDAKVHFQLDRPHSLGLVILRIFIIDSPYNTHLTPSPGRNPSPSSSADASWTLHVAFPDGAPFIYISSVNTAKSSTPSETKNVRQFLFNAIQASLSSQGRRYSLVATNIIARSLDTLTQLRGSGRGNVAGGGWSTYSASAVLDTPFETMGLNKPPPTIRLVGAPAPAGKMTGVGRYSTSERERLIAKARFGVSGKVSDGKGLERLDIAIQDPYPSSFGQASTSSEVMFSRDNTAFAIQRRPENLPFNRPALSATQHANIRPIQNIGTNPRSETLWEPKLKLVFRGPHVFAGVRQLAECGVVDGVRMPGWLTGEDGVTLGIIQSGRIANSEATV